MADNLTTQTTVATPPSGTVIAARNATYSGDSAFIAPVGLVEFSGSDDAKVATDITGLQTALSALAVPATIYNGKKAVTTAGTRVTLASSQAVKSVTIKALVANTGVIYVGDASVSSTTGFQLASGDTISMDIANLSTVNLDASVSGEGVSYLGVG